MTRRLRPAVEIISDICALGFDLQYHKDAEIADAMMFMRSANAHMFDFVARVIAKPTLPKPTLRVHGNGFIQMDLSPRHRLHVFGDERIPKQIVSSELHDHTFNFTSRILCGALTNVWFDVVDQEIGPFMVHQARIRDGEDTILIPTGRRVQIVERRRATYKTGESYSMLAGEFHESIATERTITIIEKNGPSLTQLGPSPRVLVPFGQEPDNKFNRYAASQDILIAVLADAISDASGNGGHK